MSRIASGNSGGSDTECATVADGPALVGEVRGRERRILKTGHRFGRLCEECVNDILRAQPVFRSTYSIAAVKAGRATGKGGPNPPGCLRSLAFSSLSGVKVADWLVATKRALS